MATLVYVHDPMCSWCWGFDRALQELTGRLPDQLRMTRLVGGLAPDSDEPMPVETREYIQSQWRNIEVRIPGTDFNWDFWRLCEPRRSTYPACRAVIAARQQGDVNDQRMTAAIQRAYYLQARNPSDTDTLVQLAGEIGLDKEAFAGALNSASVDTQFAHEREQARQLGVDRFPSLVLVEGETHRPIRIDYLDCEPMLAQLVQARI